MQVSLKKIYVQFATVFAAISILWKNRFVLSGEMARVKRWRMQNDAVLTER
jgi:hypothetical protein